MWSMAREARTAVALTRTIWEARQLELGAAKYKCHADGQPRLFEFGARVLRDYLNGDIGA